MASAFEAKSPASTTLSRSESKFFVIVTLISGISKKIPLFVDGYLRA